MKYVKTTDKMKEQCFTNYFPNVRIFISTKTNKNYSSSKTIITFLFDDDSMIHFQNNVNTNGIYKVEYMHHCFYTFNEFWDTIIIRSERK